jgi:hypothetical protein
MRCVYVLSEPPALLSIAASQTHTRLSLTCTVDTHRGASNLPVCCYFSRKHDTRTRLLIRCINCRIFYQYIFLRLLYPLLSADWPRYQEPDVSKCYRTRRHRPRLRYAWPVQCYRTGTVPIMDILYPSNDVRTGRDIPLEPFRRYEGNSSLNLWTVCL